MQTCDTGHGPHGETWVIKWGVAYKRDLLPLRLPGELVGWLVGWLVCRSVSVFGNERDPWVKAEKPCPLLLESTSLVHLSLRKTPELLEAQRFLNGGLTEPPKEFVFNTFFYFGVILDLQKSCKVVKVVQKVSIYHSRCFPIVNILDYWATCLKFE